MDSISGRNEGNDIENNNNVYGYISKISLKVTINNVNILFFNNYYLILSFKFLNW